MSEPDSYHSSNGHFVAGALLCAWLVVCDAVLKAVARVGGGCPGTTGVSPELLATLHARPPECAGTDMAGAAIRLRPAVNEGALLGLGSASFAGFSGQLYALALIAVAMVASIAVLRWRWRSSGDPKALGALWAGALISGTPRLLGSGAGVSEIELFGLATGVGDLALIFAFVWITARFVGEARA